MSTSMPKQFFEAFKATFENRIGVDLRRRGSELAVSHQGESEAEFGARLVGDLYAAMGGPWWTDPKRNVKSNWSWRPEGRDPSDKSDEVVLERAVCRARSKVWTYQMPTSSGLRGKHTDKRRSIDLVRMVSPHGFEFIELKVASNDPVFAAQEILGYGLAYLHARANGYQDRIDDAKGVLRASRVELVVLGPTAWYQQYFERSRSHAELEWLVRAINSGLGVERRRAPGLDQFNISLRWFSYSYIYLYQFLCSVHDYLLSNIYCYSCTDCGADLCG